MTGPGSSRRALLAAGAGALLLAGCGGDDDPRGVGKEGARDIGVLNSVLALENAVIAAYGTGAELVSGGAARAMGRVLEQEREHAAALERAVVDLGGTPVRPKSAAEYAQGYPRLREGKDLLLFAVDLEELFVKRYVDAVARLTRGKLRQTAASIAANEAEHLSVVLEALGRPGAPEAFVTGKS